MSISTNEVGVGFRSLERTARPVCRDGLELFPGRNQTGEVSFTACVGFGTCFLAYEIRRPVLSL